MNTRTHLLSTAEQLFDRHGFNATGMSRLVQHSGMSSRTLYKHIGSKNTLMATVLTERGRRFLRRLDVNSVDDLFTALETWIREESARGCLFLRAQSETGGDIPEIAEAVKDYKARLSARITDVVSREIDGGDARLAEEILILFEGATHTAIYHGVEAVTTAQRAARCLVAARRTAGAPSMDD